MYNILCNIIILCISQVWSVYYRGWLTLAMLLWTTIAWIYLHSRRNIVISLLFAISTLLVEYTYIILGDDRLKQVFGSNLRMWKFKTRDDFPIDILIKVSKIKNEVNLYVRRRCYLYNYSSYMYSYVYIPAIFFVF